MIKTATQLKAKIKHLSYGDSTKAQALMRSFLMERFLERLSCSPYHNNFILKGGVLVAAIVGMNSRATMDIDTTIQSLNLTKNSATKIITEIISADISDCVYFHINKVTEIMEDHEYTGFRFILEATIEKIHQTIKVDLSTGDIITPAAIQYPYRLMFEDRTIALWAYNLETLLAEKFETIMARGTANTRMRDFYDVYMISQQGSFDRNIFKQAFCATCEQRNTTSQIHQLRKTLETVEFDKNMERQWLNFQQHSFFVGELSWSEVMQMVNELAEAVL